MSNIVQNLMDLITPDQLGKAAVNMGESADSVTGAAKGIASSLMAEVLENGDTDQMEADLKISGDAYPVIKNSVSDIFNGNISDVAKSIGASFLGLTLGDKLGDFADLITKDYSLASGSTTTLIGMIAPIVSSSLGNNMNKNGYGISGLQSELANEKDSIVPSLPKNIGPILGISSLSVLGNRVISGASNLATGAINTGANVVDNVASGAANAAGKLGEGVGNVAGKVSDGVQDVADGAANLATGAVKKTSSFLSWLLPLLLVIGGVLLLIAVFRSCGEKSGGEGEGTTSTVDSSAMNEDTATADPADKVATQVELPNGTVLDAFKGGIEDQMVQYLNSNDYKNADEEQLKDKWFNFDNVNFVFGSSNELTPESEQQMTNVVEIMKAYPDAHIKIGAYTDKKGNDASNLKLSQERADYLNKRFVDMGIGDQVVGATGYGSKYATVPADSSDAARAVDRRMALRFDKTEPTEQAPADAAN